MSTRLFSFITAVIPLIFFGCSVDVSSPCFADEDCLNGQICKSGDCILSGTDTGSDPTDTGDPIDTGDPTDTGDPEDVESFCGDGIQDRGESCDEGENNSNVIPNACRTNCAEAWCGDGVIDSGEQCDPSEEANGDNCGQDCAWLEEEECIPCADHVECRDYFSEENWDCLSGICVDSSVYCNPQIPEQSNCNEHSICVDTTYGGRCFDPSCAACPGEGCQEICWNEIDDDLNGLSDCYDSACEMACRDDLCFQDESMRCTNDQNCAELFGPGSACFDGHCRLACQTNDPCNSAYQNGICQHLSRYDVGFCEGDNCSAFEICNNDIDDDSDGRIDCADSDCEIFCESMCEICQEDLDCGIGLRCNDGFCRARCEGDDECEYATREMICENSFCVDLRCEEAPCRSCEGDEDCDFGMGCMGNICRTVCAESTDCSMGPDGSFMDCREGVCIDPMCSDPREEICDDGRDNNGNGLIDCLEPSCCIHPFCQNQPQCFGASCMRCSDTNFCADGQFCFDGFCRTGCAPESVCYEMDDERIMCNDQGYCPYPMCDEEICNDFIDNDQNGAIDCADPACFGSSECDEECVDETEPNDPEPFTIDEIHHAAICSTDTDDVDLFRRALISIDELDLNILGPVDPFETPLIVSALDSAGSLEIVQHSDGYQILDWQSRTTIEVRSNEVFLPYRVALVKRENDCINDIYEPNNGDRIATRVDFHNFGEMQFEFDITLCPEDEDIFLFTQIPDRISVETDIKLRIMVQFADFDDEYIIDPPGETIDPPISTSGDLFIRIKAEEDSHSNAGNNVHFIAYP